jgi:pimeloyl-ACP methyl ester carboxylesterase
LPNFNERCPRSPTDLRCSSGRLRRPVFGDRERKRWEELFPNHQTVLLKGANHYIQEDSPDEIVTAIRDWSAG